MGIDKDFSSAYAKASIAAGLKLPTSGNIFITMIDKFKDQIVPVGKQLQVGLRSCRLKDLLDSETYVLQLTATQCSCFVASPGVLEFLTSLSAGLTQQMLEYILRMAATKTIESQGYS